ncbi:hypothetical protein OK016_01105 [Vibrio chagasii]|nr:hypothetical protein [Vibrio chagasii]
MATLMKSPSTVEDDGAPLPMAPMTFQPTVRDQCCRRSERSIQMLRYRLGHHLEEGQLIITRDLIAADETDPKTHDYRDQSGARLALADTATL